MTVGSGGDDCLLLKLKKEFTPNFQNPLLSNRLFWLDRGLLCALYACMKMFMLSIQDCYGKFGVTWENSLIGRLLSISFHKNCLDDNNMTWRRETEKCCKSL